jgi:nicotinate phosphoribosyltransferase
MLLRTMTQFTSPVLHSLLDTDAYKLHMQQAVFHRYGDVHVAAEFRCRGDDLLGIYADAIREQVESMRDLSCRTMNITGCPPCLFSPGLSRLAARFPL